MGEGTKIEWTTGPDSKPGYTFNPWIGCTKISPGCAHCYAESLSRFHRWATWGAREARRLTAASTWAQPLAWNRKAARDGVRRRVFCASLADVFDSRVDDMLGHGGRPVREHLWDVVRATPHLDWLLLTKRPHLVMDRVPASWASGEGGRPPEWPANVWIGATIEDQARAVERVPHLLQIPAAVRFVSCEPLVGPVFLDQIDLSGPDGGEQELHALAGWWRDEHGVRRPAAGRIHWVIAGGESGSHSRPVHPYWLKSLRIQCESFEVPFHFKQWGDWCPPENVPQERWGSHTYVELRPGAPAPSTSAHVVRAGKRYAGRVLDGRTHDASPGTTNVGGHDE